MKASLEHKYLTIDFSSDEHAVAVFGDVHEGRTKVDVSIVGSVNKGGLNELAAMLGPLAARAMNIPPADPLQAPRVVDCEEELAADLQDLAEAAAHDLGMRHGEFLAMVMNACGKAWPLQPTDYGTYTRAGDPAAPPAEPSSLAGLEASLAAMACDARHLGLTFNDVTSLFIKVAKDEWLGWERVDGHYKPSGEAVNGPA